ncbi:MAG: hypothetical protein GXP26_02550 [Planctomycetes bacterium]|nr:hypothetical protein [Planctomycetota bacterium]
MNNLKLTGILGLIGAILCGTGEFLLHFDPQARFSGYDFMADISDARLTTGHFFAVVGVSLYFVGMWHIAQMLKPAGEKLSRILFLIGCFGFLYGAMWMSSRSSIGSLAHYPELIADTNLVELYELRCETLLQVIRVTTLVISGIYVYMVLTGKSRYPKWMAATSPIVLLLLNFVIYLIAPGVGKFVMPIALNVGFTSFFLLSLFFGDHGEATETAISN